MQLGMGMGRTRLLKEEALKVPKIKSRTLRMMARMMEMMPQRKRQGSQT